MIGAPDAPIADLTAEAHSRQLRSLPHLGPRRGRDGGLEWEPGASLGSRRVPTPSDDVRVSRSLDAGGELPARLCRTGIDGLDAHGIQAARGSSPLSSTCRSEGQCDLLKIVWEPSWEPKCGLWLWLGVVSVKTRSTSTTPATAETRGTTRMPWAAVARRGAARPRRGWQADPPQVSGRTKEEVKDKLGELHRDLEAGIRRPNSRYTVAQAVADWLHEGFDGAPRRLSP
jgi:hypothetical protein